MKKVVSIVLALIFSASCCMAQLNKELEQQREREAQKQQANEQQKRQQQQAVEQQKQQEAQQLRQAAEEQRRREELQPIISITSEGTILSGSNLVTKLDWLDRMVESHNTYIIELNASDDISPRTLQYKGAINVKIILKGDNDNRIVRLTSHGRMFTVNDNVTFVLDNNITLHGHDGNTGSIVFVNGGTFIMNNGATIIGNTANSGGGVNVNSGTFTMNGGNISHNTAKEGGGVNIGYSGNFAFISGIISLNSANSGGGVYESGNFTMSGGTISGNTANTGGGVCANRNFTMHGGVITENNATINGGGVHATRSYSSKFTKTGGAITGYNSDQNNGNKVADHNGIIARRGHAVYINENMRKEITAGQGMNLSSSNNDNWGDSPPSTTATRATVDSESDNTTRAAANEQGNTSGMIIENEPAILHIYRKRRPLEIAPKRFEILLDNEVVANSTANWKTTIEINTFGTKTVSATIDGRKAEVRNNFQPGGVYYIRSEVDIKTIDTGRTQTTKSIITGKTTTSKVTESYYTPILQLVNANIGEPEINAIK